MPRMFVFAVTLGLTSCNLALAADWPQYRGPNHDGTAITIHTKKPFQFFLIKSILFILQPCLFILIKSYDITNHLQTEFLFSVQFK